MKSEKMAAFGVVAARVAHEIQNPLNFVNNFSDLSSDLIQEIVEAKNLDEVQEIASIIKQNMSKILSHGKQASRIVELLLERTRSGTVNEYFEE